MRNAPTVRQQKGRQTPLSLDLHTTAASPCEVYGRVMPHLPKVLKLAGAIALFSLSVAAVPAFAEPGNGESCKNHPDKCDPVVSATPELDSIVLFGTGLAGAGAYALTRFRARRRQDEGSDISSS
jgi:hypothetical protein